MKQKKQKVLTDMTMFSNSVLSAFFAFILAFFLGPGLLGP